jgi:predicted nucleotidyltransferase
MGRCAVAEHESLFLDVLPDLPQSDLLRQLATGLWQAKGVVALWLGGSLATGAADRYSDVDVYLAVDPEARRDWMEPDLDALHAQMARLGRELARTYEFEYPEQLEAVVLGSWEAFKTEHRL